jgi:hypothetical protein
MSDALRRRELGERWVSIIDDTVTGMANGRVVVPD